MVKKPDFSKEREEYFKVRAAIRRCSLFTLAAMAVVLLITKYFTLPKFLNLIIGILSIVLFLVMIVSVFLIWYQNYRFKRLAEGRELWYFWARIGEGIYYFFVALTRRIRAERRAKEKEYETSVQTISKIDRIYRGMSKVEEGICDHMENKDRTISNLNEDKLRLTAELEYMTAKYKAEADAMVAKTAELNLKIQEATDTVCELEEKNGILLSESNLLHEMVGRKNTRKAHTIDDILKGKAKEKAEDIKTFLFKIWNEDKYMPEGYAVRLVEFYQTMLHMDYIENNLTAYARFFYENSDSKSFDSYVKTFRNTYNRTKRNPKCEKILRNLIDS